MYQSTFTFQNKLTIETFTQYLKTRHNFVILHSCNLQVDSILNYLKTFKFLFPSLNLDAAVALLDMVGQSGAAAGSEVAVGAGERLLARVGHEVAPAVALVPPEDPPAHRTREAVVLHTHILLQIHAQVVLTQTAMIYVLYS